LSAFKLRVLPVVAKATKKARPCFAPFLVVISLRHLLLCLHPFYCEIYGVVTGLKRGIPMQERTLAIIKPDGVARGLVGEVIGRLENVGYRIIAMKMVQLSKAEAEIFYAVHKGRPFYEGLVDFMCSGPSVVLVLEGEDIIARYREMMGATDPATAEEGSLRKAFATDGRHNVVHGSDSLENAAFEIGFFFSALELTA